MTVTALKPFVPSGPDFELARSFFEALGFRVNWQAEGLAELELGAATFLLQAYENRELQENLMLMVEVDDLDAWWQELEASGVLSRFPGARANPPQEFPWGRREVHLIDPAGVCWHFA